MEHLASLREHYTKGSLDVADVATKPFEQFRQWFQEALDSQVPEPNAMHLSTVSPAGKPSGRILLLKGLDERGFTFFTNYYSRKGHEIGHNPNACVTFFWVELERQIRIEGVLEKVTEEESDAYFAVRPRASQLGAWVSEQSTVIQHRDVLVAQEKRLENKYDGLVVPRPPHWGGYRLVPTYLEFWQGRPSRLHDRIAYTLQEDGHHWAIERLSP